MPDLPDGIITLLMTDIEGSTALWERDPMAMARAVVRHEAIIDEEVSAGEGHVLKEKGEGDSIFAVFGHPERALEAAIRIQRRLASETWEEASIVVRIGIHIGEAIRRGRDYFGPTVNRCARLRSVAHGRQIVLSQSVRNAAGELPDGVELRDLGVHRLKDLQEPIRIFDVQDREAPHPHASVRSLSILPNNLPVQLTSFVGRTADLERVSHLLRSERVITLIGAGGCGKTRLAQQVAADVSHHFPGGVWFVPLAPVTDGDEVISSIANVLNAPSDDIADTAARLGAGRSLLLLDNTEHVSSGAAAAVDQLLRSVPDLVILATSRTPLGVAGEQNYLVPSLSIPPRDRRLDAAEAMDFDAVRLFVERAQARDPHFSLEGPHARPVVELCLAVDGIPLAIEFLASHVLAFSPSQMLRRIKAYLRPSLEAVGGDSRHRTMEDAIRWSFDALAPSEQRAFLAYSVFSNGFSSEAAEGLLDDDHEALPSLVNKSLVQTESGPGGERRYRLLQPFRDFAQERLQRREEWLAKHARVFADFVADAGNRIEGEGQAYWLEALDHDIDNIRQALEWVQAHDPAALPRFVYPLRHYWGRRAAAREALVWHERAANVDGDPDLRANLLNSLGAVRWRLGDLAGAERAFAESLAFAERSLNEDLAAKARNNLAILFAGQGRLREAKPLYERSLVYYRATGEELFEGTTLSNLGDLETRAGDSDAAVAYLEEARDLFERIGNVAKVARVSYNLAIALHAAQRPEEAVAALHTSFEAWRSVTDPAFLAEGLALLARILAEARSFEDAVRLAFASEAITRECGATPSPEQREAVRAVRAAVSAREWEARRRGPVMDGSEAAIAFALGSIGRLPLMRSQGN